MAMIGNAFLMRLWEEMHELGLAKEGSPRQQSCFTGLMNAAASTGLVKRFRHEHFPLIQWCSHACNHLEETCACVCACFFGCLFAQRWCADSTERDWLSALWCPAELCTFWLLTEGDPLERIGRHWNAFNAEKCHATKVWECRAESKHSIASVATHTQTDTLRLAVKVQTQKQLGKSSFRWGMQGWSNLSHLQWIALHLMHVYACLSFFCVQL